MLFFIRNPLKVACRGRERASDFKGGRVVEWSGGRDDVVASFLAFRHCTKTPVRITAGTLHGLTVHSLPGCVDFPYSDLHWNNSLGFLLLRISNLKLSSLSSLSLGY